MSTNNISDTTVINIQEEFPPPFSDLVDDSDDSEECVIDIDDEYFFNFENVHYIWKPVKEPDSDRISYQATHYWLKTNEGIVKKRMLLPRTM